MEIPLLMLSGFQTGENKQLFIHGISLLLFSLISFFDLLRFSLFGQDFIPKNFLILIEYAVPEFAKIGNQIVIFYNCGLLNLIP